MSDTIGNLPAAACQRYKGQAALVREYVASMKVRTDMLRAELTRRDA